MNWKKLFSERAARLTPSVMEEMVLLACRPETISFTAGSPSEDLYPAEELRQALNYVLCSCPDVLDYPYIEGNEELRKWIAEWMTAKGTASPGLRSKDIVLTNGALGGLSLLAELLLDPGDAIMVENPSYPDALDVFRREGVNFLPVSMDEEGPLVEEIEEHLKKGPIRFLYTIPSFQNPTGGSTSESRKKKILALAEKHDFYILEDDPYRQLWYEKMPPSTYLSLSENSERVIYQGSFSKIVAPGIRCGWLVLPEKLREKALQLKLTLDMGLPTLLQSAICRILSGPGFEDHLKRLRDTYRKRRNAMQEVLEREASPLGVKCSPAEGGLFLWGRMEGIDAEEFARYAVQEEGVGIMPGNIFYVDSAEKSEEFRLSFARVSTEEIVDGIRRLASALKKFRS